MQKLKKSWKNYLSRSLTAVHCITVCIRFKYVHAREICSRVRIRRYHTDHHQTHPSCDHYTLAHIPAQCPDTPSIVFIQNIGAPPARFIFNFLTEIFRFCLSIEIKAIPTKAETRGHELDMNWTGG